MKWTLPMGKMMIMLSGVPGFFLGKTVKPFLFFVVPVHLARFVPHHAPTLTKVDNLMKKVDSSPLDYETFSKLMEDIPRSCRGRIGQTGFL